MSISADDHEKFQALKEVLRKKFELKKIEEPQITFYSGKHCRIEFFLGIETNKLFLSVFNALSLQVVYDHSMSGTEIFYLMFVENLIQRGENHHKLFTKGTGEKHRDIQRQLFAKYDTKKKSWLI